MATRKRPAKKRAVKSSRKPKEKWIGKMDLKKGALRKELGVKKGEKIPAKKLNAAAKKKGKIGKRARLAKTFKKMKKR